jgi:predicted flap endonuclease-1-like 5' DNA nuclease
MVMALMTELPGMGAARERAAKAISFPIGVASPLWLAFGAAASAGVAWWWLSKLTRPVNLEAFLLPVTKAPMAPVIEDVAVEIEAVAEAVAEAPAAAELSPEPEAVVEAAPEPAPQAVVEAAPEPAPATVIEAAAEPVVETPAAPTPDDLTLLVGIGPKLALALAERGVTRFADLAAWTAKDLAEADAALSLKGRAVRDAWVAQARRFAEQKL